MATPFRRRGYHGAYLVGIGELRRFTISGNRQDAGQATAAIPRSSRDGAREIQNPLFSYHSERIPIEAILNLYLCAAPCFTDVRRFGFGR